jgi:RNA polymerase sigma-70 factor (ECF subfamily)
MIPRKPRFDVTGELPALRRYGVVLTQDPAEAEDLVQECLLRAYEKRGSFNSDKELRPWLLSILHNCFVDGVRKKRVEKAFLAITSQISDAHLSPPQESQIRLAQLRQSFMALPEEQRTALHLVAIEGLSYQEAASALGIPAGTLMSRLGRARAALRSIEDAGEVQPSSRAASPALQLKIVGGKDDESN